MSREFAVFGTELLPLRVPKQIGIVVTDVPHAVTDRPGQHFLSGVGAEQVNRCARRVAGIKPAVVVAPFQDHRHPVVKRLCYFVGIGRDDREVSSGEPSLGCQRSHSPANA